MSAVTLVSPDDLARQALGDGGTPPGAAGTARVGELLLPALVVAYVVTCAWLQDARARSHLISPLSPHRHARVVVWAGWVVPVANLWLPYQVVRDVLAASEPERVRRPGAGLGLWWVAWAGFVLVPLVPAAIMAVSDRPLIDLLPVLDTVAAALAVVACLEWARIVVRVSRLQRPQRGGA